MEKVSADMLSNLPSSPKCNPALGKDKAPPLPAALFVYGDERSLQALRAACEEKDKGFQAELLHGIPYKSSRDSCCLSVAFSTEFLQANCGVGLQDCPAQLLQEAVCGRAGCCLAPAQVVATSQALVRCIVGTHPEVCINPSEDIVPAHHEAAFEASASLTMDKDMVARLRAYHGEEVGGYFLFLVSYQYALLIAGCVGVLLFLLPLGLPGAKLKDFLLMEMAPSVSPTYAFLLPVWMIIALKLWSWKQDDVKREWTPAALPSGSLLLAEPLAGHGLGSSHGHSSSSSHGHGSSGGGSHSHGGGGEDLSSWGEDLSSWGRKEGVKMLVFALPLVIAYSGVSFVAYRFCEEFSEHLGSDLLNNVLQLVVHWFFAEFMAETVAKKSAELVVPHGHSALEALELRILLLLLQIINHAPLLYMAFWERNLAAIRERLIFFLGVKQFIVFPVAQMAMPWVQAHVFAHWSSILGSLLGGGSGKKSGEGAIGGGGGGGGGSGAPAASAADPAMQPAPEDNAKRALALAAEEFLDLAPFLPDEEHKQLFTQLSMILMWGSVFPIAPMLCFLSNLVELWVDSSKLKGLRRCFGLGGGGLLDREARWTSALKGMAFVACAVNAALLIAAEAGTIEGAGHHHGGHASGGETPGGSHGSSQSGTHGSAASAWGSTTLKGMAFAFALEHAAFAVMMAVDLLLPEHYNSNAGAPKRKKND